MCWQSSTRGLSQIWLHIREDSIKVWEPCYIVWQHAKTCCLNMATSKNICPDNVATKGQKAFVLVARPFFSCHVAKFMPKID